MNLSDESIWERIAKTLFGVHKMADERLFTSRVMAQVRQRQPADRAWPAFLRWTVPALGMAMASLVLAVRAPEWWTIPSTDTLLFQSQTADDDLVATTLEDQP